MAPWAEVSASTRAAARHFASRLVGRPNTSSGPFSSVTTTPRDPISSSFERRSSGSGAAPAIVERPQRAAVGELGADRRPAQHEARQGRARRSTPRSSTPAPVTGIRRSPSPASAATGRRSTTSIVIACGKSVLTRRSSTDVNEAIGLAQRVLAHVQRRHLLRGALERGAHALAVRGGHAGDLDVADGDEARVAQPHPAARGQRDAPRPEPEAVAQRSRGQRHRAEPSTPCRPPS